MQFWLFFSHSVVDNNRPNQIIPTRISQQRCQVFLSWSLDYRDWKSLVQKSYIMFEMRLYFSRLIWFSDLLILNLKCVRSERTATEQPVMKSRNERRCCWGPKWSKRDVRVMPQCGAHDSWFRLLLFTRDLLVILFVTSGSSSLRDNKRRILFMRMLTKFLQNLT